jgi:sorbose reductase
MAWSRRVRLMRLVVSGSIVNIPVNQAAYNATKAGARPPPSPLYASLLTRHAAVIHLCRSLAVEWKAFARVNTVSPGFFHTGMGAGPAVTKVAHEMAVLGRQGDVKELKGVRVL